MHKALNVTCHFMTHTKKFIAYLDILGFKDLVQNNTHKRLFELYDKLFTNITTFAIGGKFNFIEKDGHRKAVYDSSQIILNSLIISDSIILWTDDNSMKSFIDIVVGVKNILNHHFITGVPLRGAIVEGHIDKINRTFLSNKDNSQITLIGLGLVQAYLKENEQDWSGCIVDKSCIELFLSYVEEHKDSEDVATLEYLVEKDLLLKYKAPLKSGNIKEEYVINWVKTPQNIIDEIRARKMFSEFNKSTDNWRAENIIRNTIDFINIASK